MTLPRSSGCTRTSRTLPRRSDLLATWTSSGYWTMPRTRCSRASSSTLGSAPRVALGGLRVGGLSIGALRVSGLRVGIARVSVGIARVSGSLARGVGDGGCGRRGLALGLRLGTLGHRGLALGLRDGGLGRRGPVLGGTVLGSSVLGSTVLGSSVLGGSALGGLGRLAGGLALLGAFLGFLAGQALLGGGREGFLLVRLRRGRLQRALGTRLAGELLPVPGDLEQDADRVSGLRAHREPVLHPLGVHFDERGLGLRVVLADLLDGAPVALGACVGDDDPVVGLPYLAQGLQFDLDSHGCGLLPALRCDAAEPRRPGKQPTGPHR